MYVLACKKTSDLVREMPQSQITDQPMVPKERDTRTQTKKNTLKQSNQLSLSMVVQ